MFLYDWLLSHNLLSWNKFFFVCLYLISYFLKSHKMNINDQHKESWLGTIILWRKNKILWNLEEKLAGYSTYMEKLLSQWSCISSECSLLVPKKFSLCRNMSVTSKSYYCLGKSVVLAQTLFSLRRISEIFTFETPLYISHSWSKKLSYLWKAITMYRTIL